MVFVALPTVARTISIPGSARLSPALSAPRIGEVNPAPIIGYQTPVTR